MDYPEIVLDNSAAFFVTMVAGNTRKKNHFGAKYSLSDILLTTLGGVLAIGLVHQLK